MKIISALVIALTVTEAKKGKVKFVHQINTVFVLKSVPPIGV